ncbi:MAG: sulfite exporter TauE/SafE family protein [Woeseiaceae bacterium]
MFVEDALFYLAAVPAVLIYGMGKGGLGGAAGAVSVPMMSLTIEPVQAAAILLPIICFMDLQVARLFWGKFDVASLRIIIPAALIGVAIGASLLGVLPAAGMRLTLGIIAVLFCVDYVARRRGEKQRLAPGPWSGRFWGVIAGITSTHVHAGGPPISIYLLPKNLDKVILVGTFGVFFFVLNYVKLIPYAMLGQFDTRNLITSLILLPVAPIGVWLGYRFLHYFDQATIYRTIYAFLFITGLKLLYDGVTGL